MPNASTPGPNAVKTDWTFLPSPTAATEPQHREINSKPEVCSSYFFSLPSFNYDTILPPLDGNPIFFGQPTQNGVVAYSQMVVPSTTRTDNESKGEGKRYFIYTVRYQLEKTGEA
jgi:hypothetical protein